MQLFFILKTIGINLPDNHRLSSDILALWSTHLRLLGRKGSGLIVAIIT